MPTVGNTFPTIVDVTKRMDPTGSIASVAEILAKYNPMLDDVAWKEGNLPTGHRVTARSGLPSPKWRRFNQGIVADKSLTEQYDETCGMLEDWSNVDVDLAKLNGNEMAFRASEDQAFLQSFNIQLATSLIYESTVSNPAGFQGLTPRLNNTCLPATPTNPATIKGTGPANYGQFIPGDASASGANQTSVWLVGWSDETVFGIYPKGSVGGITVKDMGALPCKDGAGNEYEAYRTKFQWKCGLCVRDWRFIARIGNIDVVRWKEDLTQGADIAMRMIDALTAIFNLDVCRPVYYMARQTYAMLNKQLVKRQANWLEFINQGGKRIPAFMGIPIRFVDSITLAESVVTLV